MCVKLTQITFFGQGSHRKDALFRTLIKRKMIWKLPRSRARSASWATNDQENQSNDSQKKENHLENNSWNISGSQGTGWVGKTKLTNQDKNHFMVFKRGHFGHWFRPLSVPLLFRASGISQLSRQAQLDCSQIFSEQLLQERAQCLLHPIGWIPVPSAIHNFLTHALHSGMSW